MSDPNKNDFDARVSRIQTARAQGFGFEAAGALGRSHFLRRPARRRPVFRAAVFLCCVCFGLKGALHHHLGADSYDLRVAGIESRGGFDAVQGFLLRSDPVTEAISAAIGGVLTLSRS